MTEKNAPDLTRRGVIRGVAVGGLALPLLTACGGDETSTTSTQGTSTPAGSASSPTTAGGGSGGPSVPTADVPVGGGAIFTDDEENTYVVTQPTEGEFKAFSGICTHQKCPVSDINAEGQIHCRCHGSLYSIEDGSVEGGPAPAPLPELTATVEGDQVVVSS